MLSKNTELFQDKYNLINLIYYDFFQTAAPSLTLITLKQER